LRHTIRILQVTGAFISFTWFSLIATAGDRSNTWASTQFAHATRMIVIATPASSPTISSNGSGGLDPIIVAAIIGLGGVVLGALIAGGVVLYQTQRMAQLQREQLRIQHQQAQEIARLQQELQEQAALKERERQRKEMNAEAALAAMERATTLAEQTKAYSDSLRADPRIARLQILDMDRPLELTSIYVSLRLHQDTRVRYEIDSSLLEAEAKMDPNAFIRAQQRHLEQRNTIALDPDEAIRTHKHCVIVGDPGAGKTTLLKYLALR
jgi:flagellar biosynthesis GTPase FlhF